MYKKIFVFIIYLFPLFHFSQDFSDLWKGYFSYNEIKDIAQGNNKIYAAGDNAVFSYDTQTKEIVEINTVNGLSGESISTIYYSETYELLVIGYENGLIEIAFDNDDDILTVVDIVEKPTIPPTDKKINHFSPYQDVIYISTNYGISVFNLERLEFGDSYFIGNGGSQIQVNQTAIFGDYIYAACIDGSGIRKAEVSSPNLIDYQNWQVINSGNWLSIETQEDKLYAIGTNRRIYEIVNDALSERFLYADSPLDLRSNNRNLVVTTKNNVFVYDESFNLISQVSIDPSFETQYVVSTIDSENIYIGTKDFGILKTPLTSPTTFEEIHPDGPLLNIPFSIQAESNGLWVSYGEYTVSFNPYPLNNRGFSHLKDGAWVNTRYSEVLEAKCLNTITVNPFNTEQVFISSYFNGLLEVNDDLPTTLYNQTNSGLESLVSLSNPNYVDIRVGPTVFDENGLLWTLTAFVEKPLKSYNPSTNQWNSFSFANISSVPSDFRFSEMLIGDDGTKWMSSFRNGLIGFNENGGNPLIKSVSGEGENMPTELATALALDKQNQLWIGTFRGLRVLYNISNFFTEENIQVEEIIIEEDGIAKELLFQQNITDIKVDGANNKWIGTTDSGLFYFSPDGQRTIFHFTKDNSPLPTNSIRDVSLDETNGVVYIATNKGLVSFNAGGSSTVEDLKTAYVYPNPVRPSFNIVEDQVKIKDISENVNVKITDIEGNLVAEAQSKTNQRYNGYNLEIDGGTAYWNGKNFANNVVASGVYLVMLSDLDTFETKVLKLMVVR